MALPSSFVGGGSSRGHFRDALLHEESTSIRQQLLASQSQSEQRNQEEEYENNNMNTIHNNNSDDSLGDIIWDSPTRGRIRRRPSSSSSSSTPAASTSSSSSSSRTSDFKVHLPPALCDFCSFFWDWTNAAVGMWVELLTAPPFPSGTLHKVSIVLLGMEKLRDNLEQSVMNNSSHKWGGSPYGLLVWTTGTGGPSANAPSSYGEATNAVLYSIPQCLVWGLPAAIALLTVSFVILLQLSWGHQEEAVIATALISLIFLEALLPLFILGCTSMFLFHQVTWETGLALLVVVWLGSTFCAHCIRRMLYQSLGHG